MNEIEKREEIKKLLKQIVLLPIVLIVIPSFCFSNGLDLVDVIALGCLILALFVIFSIAIECIRECIMKKKYGNIICISIVIILLLLGGYQKTSEIVTAAKEEHEMEILKNKREQPKALPQIDINSIPDEEGTYKSGKYTVGYDIEEGLYNVLWIGGSSVIYRNGVPDISVNLYEKSGRFEYKGARLYKGDLIEIPENTAVKFLKRTVLGENN